MQNDRLDQAVNANLSTLMDLLRQNQHGPTIDDATARAEIDDIEFDPTLAANENNWSIGKYRVLDCLGIGGQSAVFIAFDPDLARNVAIKLYHESKNNDAANDVVNEGRVLARIRSAYVVKCHDVGQFLGLPYLVMDYITGHPLDIYLQDESPGIDELQRLIRQIADGMCAVHESALLHRDLKPSNIMIDVDRIPRIIDFGLAGRPSGLAEKPNCGSPGFRSPEQEDGASAQIDTRSDIYSFGVTVRQMLSVDSGTRTRHDNQVRRLQKLVEDCTQRRPQDRPQSFRDVIRFLDTSDDPVRKSRVSVLLTASAILVAAVAVFAMSHFSKDRTEPSQVVESSGSRPVPADLSRLKDFRLDVEVNGVAAKPGMKRLEVQEGSSLHLRVCSQSDVYIRVLAVADRESPVTLYPNSTDRDRLLASGEWHDLRPDDGSSLKCLASTSTETLFVVASPSRQRMNDFLASVPEIVARVKLINEPSPTRAVTRQTPDGISVVRIPYFVNPTATDVRQAVNSLVKTYALETEHDQDSVNVFWRSVLGESRPEIQNRALWVTIERQARKAAELLVDEGDHGPAFELAASLIPLEREFFRVNPDYLHYSEEFVGASLQTIAEYHLQGRKVAEPEVAAPFLSLARRVRQYYFVLPRAAIASYKSDMMMHRVRRKPIAAERLLRKLEAGVRGMSTGDGDLLLTHVAVGQMWAFKNETRAIHAFETARNLAPDSTAHLELLRNLSLVYERIGNISAARSTAECAVKTALRNYGPDDLEMGFASRRFGHCLMSMELYDQAMPHLQTAAEVFHQHRKVQWFAEVYGDIGRIYEVQGHSEKALGHYEAETRHLSIGFPITAPTRILATLRWANSLALHARYTEAITALSDLGADHSFVTLHKIHRLRAYIDALAGDRDSCREHLELAEEFIGLSAGNNREQRLRFTECKASIAALEKDIVNEIPLRQAAIATALQLASEQSASYARHELLVRSRELQTALDNFLFRSRNADLSDADAYRMVWDVRNWATRVMANQTASMGSDGEPSSVISPVFSDSSPETLIEMLPDDCAVVQFVEVRPKLKFGIQGRGLVDDDDRSYEAFVLRRDRESNAISVTRHVLGPADRIEASVDRLGVALHSASPEQSIRAAQDASQCVWRHIADDIRDARMIYIIPDGKLGRMPWTLLPTNDNGRRVIDQHLICIALDGQMLHSTLCLETVTPAAALLVGDVDYGEAAKNQFWSALPQSAAEIDCVDKQLKRTNSALRISRLTGRSATPSRVVSELQNADVIHIATHVAHLDKYDGGQRQVTSNAESLMSTALVLSDANLKKHADLPWQHLTADQIARLPARRRSLAFCSGCRSADGYEPVGEASVTLLRAFRIAGYASTVGYTWPISDNECQQFVDEFYRQYSSKGRTKAEAFRRAQLALIDTNARVAGWVLTGDYR